MFVFGFVGDSLAATTTGPLLGAIQRLEMLTPGKQREHSTGKVAARESGHYIPYLRYKFGFKVPEPCTVWSPSLVWAVDFD